MRSALAFLSGFLLLASSSPARAQVNYAQLEVLASLPGETPLTELVATVQGDFYGATDRRVFKFAADGTLTTLYAFTHPGDPQTPRSLFLEESSDTLYGTSDAGGGTGCGTVYRLTPARVLTIIHSFACEPAGTRPTIAPILVWDDLYGTTHSGGAYGLGSFYTVNASTGAFLTIHEFSGQLWDGAYPVSATNGPGSIVGGTEGTAAIPGTLFSFDYNTRAFTVFYVESGASFGAITTQLSPGPSAFLGWERQPGRPPRLFALETTPYSYRASAFDDVVAEPVGRPMVVQGGYTRVVVSNGPTGPRVYSRGRLDPDVAHYIGGDPRQQLMAGLTTKPLPPDQRWYGVALFSPDATTRIGQIVRFNPQATLSVSTSAAGVESLAPFGTPTIPLVAGRMTTWRAQSRGAFAGLLSETFWVRSTAGWHLMRPDLPGADSFSWTPTKPGRYIVQGWVRDHYSAGPVDWYQTTAEFDVAPADAISVTSFQPALGTALGQPRVWQAGATGGAGPLQYQFWVFESGVGWHIAQPWSVMSTLTWTPPHDGTYALQVWVRSAGSTALYEAWRGYGPFTVTNESLEIVDIAPDRPLPVGPGAAVSWTVETVGGTGAPLEYQFFSYRPGSAAPWTLLQAWSASPTVTWTPASADVGNYWLQVWARRSGSAAPWEAWANSAPFSISSASTPLALTLTSDQGPAPSFETPFPLPIPVETPIRWRALATNAKGALEYAFFQFDSLTAQWTAVQPYGPSDTYIWTPSASQAGAGRLEVWVRHVGSGQPYEVVVDGYFAVQP